MEKAKTKILLVEDEQGVREAVSKILTKYGYTVVTAGDGEEGLKCFDDHGGFDIVFTDLSLPGLSGWDVAAAVRQKSPVTPVVLLSGWDIDDRDERIGQSGISGILAKPVRMKEMIKVVEELIKAAAEG